jgi:hypothetical protein
MTLGEEGAMLDQECFPKEGSSCLITVYHAVPL